MTAESLSASQLRRIAEHRYSAEGVSLLEPSLQVFWRWLVEQVPRSWAPNAITVSGLLLNIVTTLLMVYYSPNAVQEVPSWVYVLSALGLFIYQSLDAIDGKQARRTSTSSPLGELFDHGCDSVSTVFVAVGICIALGLGAYPGWMFFNCFAAMFLFYCAHWQSYVSGTLRFGILDVTEGQITIMLIYLINAFVGAHIWDIQVPVIDVPVRLVPVYFGIFIALLQCKRNFSVIFMEGGIGKNGSTTAKPGMGSIYGQEARIMERNVQVNADARRDASRSSKGTSTIFPMLPITIVIGLALVIYWKSPTHIYERNPCLYIITFGMVAAKVTNKLVIAHMTKSEMDLLDKTFLGPLSLCLNQYFDCVINEYLVLWLCCLYCTYNLLRYAHKLSLQISRYLNIYCFTITSKLSKPQTESKNGRNYKK